MESQPSLLEWAPAKSPKNFTYDGPEYRPQHDKVRLAAQTLRIREVMIDGRWRSLSEIAALTGFGEASISAQLRHLKKPRFGSHIVPKRPRGERRHGLFEYCVLPPDPNAPKKEHGAESKRVIQALRAEVQALKDELVIARRRCDGCEICRGRR